MQWHEPRPIHTLKELYDWPDEVGVGGSVLVYNPCDGWHLLWTMEYGDPDEVYRMKCFEAWMPGPPEPVWFDREEWMNRTR